MADPASKTDAPSLRPRFIRRLCNWRTARRALIALACVVTFVTLFYTVEDWRGKRAWEQCKRELEAKGEVLDWAAYIPPPVPDDQNIFKAPNMQEWFVGRGETNLYRRLLPRTFNEFMRLRETNVVVEITVAPPDAPVAASNIDLTLRYDSPFLMIEGSQTNLPFLSESKTSTVPLIVMENVPLSDAIRELARAAKLKYTLDPKLHEQGLYLETDRRPQPVISIRWEKITAREALVALLANYNLQLVTNSKNGMVQITVKDPDGPPVSVDWNAREPISSLIRKAIERTTNNLPGPILKSPLHFIFSATRPNPIKPVRIVVRASNTPTLVEIAGFLPKTTLGATEPDSGHLRVDAVCDNSFRVLLDSPPITAAVDYLAWSDQLKTDFDRIREALKRPYARMDLDYQQPYGNSFPNYVMIRVIAQTLASRAQCYFLVNQPDEALRELTLMHDLCRMLEGAPTGKPMMLVPAMIKVAVTGLYAKTVADGFKLNAWREPELIALTAQLKSTDCLPQVAEALRDERAAASYMLEKAPVHDMTDRYLYFNDRPTNLWERLKIPIYPFLILAPRGWVYQNLVTRAALVESELGTYDLNNNLVLPGKMAEITAAVERLNPHNPYTFLVAQVPVPGGRVLWTFAQNQTKVNEALIVCALERYRVAQGGYPESLDALAPRFMDKLPHDLIGGQPLHYRRAAGGKFLLYSIGLNETDDGGQVVLDKDGRPAMDQGDWVWENF